MLGFLQKAHKALLVPGSLSWFPFTLINSTKLTCISIGDPVLIVFLADSSCFCLDPWGWVSDPSNSDIGKTQSWRVWGGRRRVNHGSLKVRVPIASKWCWMLYLSRLLWGLAAVAQRRSSGQKPYAPTAAKTGKFEALSNQNLPVHLQTYRVVKVVLACKALSRASAPKLPSACTVCSHMQIADADVLVVDHLHDLDLKVAEDTHLVPWPLIYQESGSLTQTTLCDRHRLSIF